MQCVDRSRQGAFVKSAGLIAAFAVLLWCVSVLPIRGDTMPQPTKQIIGATATIVEATSGLPFAARIDTGATTCSIHAIKWEIEDPARRPPDNVGKPIRVLIKNEKGDEAWVDSVIASRVRVRSSVQDESDYHGRYKVRLPLEWNGVAKDVLVTINDRSEMDYPLLIGRNFLRGDFLVDVDVNRSGIHADRQAERGK
jgi:hypothetical protein